MKYTIIFIILALHHTGMASVDSFVKGYLYQEEGCQNITTREDKFIPISMNHFVNHAQNALYPETTSCDPNDLEKYRFQDFLVNTMEGRLNIDAKTLCANVKSIPNNGKFNLDWEAQFKDLLSLGNNNAIQEKLKLKLNIINHSIALVKSCQWQWGPDQIWHNEAKSQLCVIEMNDFFHHNSAEFVSSYSPELISKKIKGCLDQFPGTLIENVSVFISSDGTHSKGSDLKSINEQLTKDRLSKVKSQLTNIFNSSELRSNVGNEVKIESTLGWNDFGSSGPEKIITTNDSLAKQELQKYRKTTITVFLNKKLDKITGEKFKGNLTLNCLSTIYSCAQTENSLGKEVATIILKNNNETESTALINNSTEAKGI